MIGLKSPTIVDVENGKEISYSKLLEGKTVEDSSTYHPRSGLWECKNGEVINVAESIRQGKRVVAEPRHYHNNKGMCPSSGKVMDTETGTEIDLIDSILASGGGSGQIRIPFMPVDFNDNMFGETSSNVIKCNVTSNDGYQKIINFYFIKTTPGINGDMAYITLNDNVRGIVATNRGFMTNPYLIGVKGEYYYFVCKKEGTKNTLSIQRLKKGLLNRNIEYLKDLKVVEGIFFIVKNDEKQQYDLFEINEYGNLLYIDSIGYLEYSDRPLLGYIGYVHNNYIEGTEFGRLVNDNLALVDFNGVQELLNRATTLEEDYGLMNDEHKPTLWSRFKSLFNFK